jgi:DNA-binding SARP family transcriptional activator/tetratricopeptide (TPR) repeat protein
VNLESAGQAVFVAVTFRLLGEVEAHDGDRRIPLGHARQQCVLVALLVDANHAVAVDQLIYRVWADRPPQRARAALYSYLSRLRQILAGTEVTIDRRPAGYQLTVDAMAVDVHAFQALVTQGRYDAALDLWQGEPFATLDTPWLNEIRDALHQRWLSALLDRNDLALASGAHAELLAHLHPLAAAYPLDERVAGQLALALYRSGRQAEALDELVRIQHRLVDQLGVDPSPPLRQLHRQILTTDPVVAAPAPPSPGQKMEPPSQLPHGMRDFTGRTDELDRLDALLAADDEQTAAGVLIIALTGTAGVGKTALAVQWAHRIRDRFPDGQLYVNLRGFDPGGAALEPADAVRGFLDALAVAPRALPVSLEAQAALYRSQLTGRRVLVVLDNARDADQVRPLLPGAPGCAVIVTSRNHLPGLVAVEGAHPVAVDLLSHPSARELLGRRLGVRRVAAEPDAVDAIVAACAGLPLALAIVAARAANHPAFRLTDLADELADSAGRLDVLDDADPSTDVRAVFSWSYQALGQLAARLFRLLGLAPGPDISVPAAASLAGVPVPVARRLLAELERAHLVFELSPRRYTCHDLLRAYAAEQAHTLDAAPDRAAASRRVLDFYLQTAHAAVRTLYPHRDPIILPPSRLTVPTPELADRDQATTWFTAELPVLVGAIEYAADAGLDAHTWQLAWLLSTVLDRAAHWHDAVATQRTALAAAVRSGDRTGEALSSRSLALAYGQLGDHATALPHLDHALALFAGSGDRTGQAHTHLLYAWLYGRQDRHRDALSHAERGLRLYRDTADPAGQAAALNAIGWFHCLLGDHEQGLRSCQQALVLHRRNGDSYGLAQTWDSLGYAHHQLDQPERAIVCYRHAVELWRAGGIRYQEAVTLSRLGEAHETIGQLDRARELWRTALAILDDLGSADTESDRLRRNLGRPPRLPTYHLDNRCPA